MSKRLLPLLLALGGTLAMAQAPRLDTVVEGLKTPWALAFLPGGQFLITERDGALRTATPGGKPSAPIQGVPAVDAVGPGRPAGRAGGQRLRPQPHDLLLLRRGR